MFHARFTLKGYARARKAAEETLKTYLTPVCHVRSSLEATELGEETLKTCGQILEKTKISPQSDRPVAGDGKATI